MKKFDFIQFDEATHSYYNTEIKRKVPSVTTVLGKLNPFNKGYWLPKKAKELGVSEAELEKQWDDKRDKAAAHGSRFHKYIEDKLQMVETKDKFISADKYLEDYKNDLTIACEMIVGNDCIAGTFDNLALRNGMYILKDWKTNEEFTTSSKYKLKVPYDYLDDCKFNIYALQLSMYRVLLDLPIYKMEVVHFTETDYTVYEVPYMEREARQIIKKLRDDNS